MIKKIGQHLPLIHPCGNSLDTTFFAQTIQGPIGSLHRIREVFVGIMNMQNVNCVHAKTLKAFLMGPQHSIVREIKNEALV